ncbi:hypothetical protein [Pectobacterium zantedeschiae]|uniref:Uncharacterized protein n=1 Tax=Pectobacterium zantedeschiae TaxID=2034769 RepID=A0A9X8JIC7_9GAMM|nr:hypothetical protein [Pectobacterium zantedeschiae]RYC43649.1 hypothetical protein CLR69_00910 [Pectobacterium zantedeschiae]RYC49129.1 hypothetical protein CTN06_06710 [Pectobacterium zantedeschiae]
MASFMDGRSSVLFLFTALKLKRVIFPPEAGESDIDSYEKRVKRYLLNKGEDEIKVDYYLNKVREDSAKLLPDENELTWLKNDSRASYWFLLKIDNPSYIREDDILLGGTDELVLVESSLGKKVPPKHGARINFIKEKIRENIPKAVKGYSIKEFILNSHNEWIDLISHDDLFSDINGRTGVTIDWLLNYLRDNNITTSGYRCGDSIDEKIAYCYAAYFNWCKIINLDFNDARKELFINKFKSALSTQKSRVKKRAEKYKDLNVTILQETHDKIREISKIEGISNSRIIEYAIHIAWQQKKNRQLK